MENVTQIERLHLEITTKCNARCPMCMRNYRGSDYNAGYPVTELSFEQFCNIFSPKFLQQLKVVQFNGNLGDFGMSTHAEPILNYILQHSDCEVYIETNGSMRRPEWWARLADPKITIFWALDGINDITHQLYRIGANFDSALANAKAFIDAGGKAVWKFIPFAHNENQIATAKRMSQDLGFYDFAIWDQGRNQGPVFTKEGQFSHFLGTEVERIPMLHLLESHKTWFDVNDVNQHASTQIKCNHKQQKEIYCNAIGEIYPCCFLAFYPSTMNHPGNSQLLPLVRENNALEFGLEHAIQWFSSVYQSWNLESTKAGKLYMCSEACGVCSH